MVWVKPVPACEQAHLRWFTLNRNDFFQLQVSDSDEKEIKQSYRILFTEKGGEFPHWLRIDLSDIYLQMVPFPSLWPRKIQNPQCVKIGCI